MHSQAPSSARARSPWIASLSLIGAFLGVSIPSGCNDAAEPSKEPPARPVPPVVPEHSGTRWEGEGALTIEELGVRLRDSGVTGDWSELLACLMPGDRALIAFLTIVETEGDEEALTAGTLENLCAQFGIPLPSAMGFDPLNVDLNTFKPKIEAVYERVDLVALITALETALEGRDLDISDPWLYGSGAITDVVQEGPRATGLLDDVPVKFTRIDGRWFIGVELM